MRQGSEVRSPESRPTRERIAGAPQGLILGVAGFLPVLTILSLAPAVPTLLGHYASVPSATTLVPLMVTAPGLMVALLAPFAGFAVDRFGRRNLILLATLFYAVLGISPFFLHGLPAVFASRLGVGAAEVFILIIVNALFADYFTVERRRTWLTAQGLIGPILGTASIASAGALTAIYWNGAFLLYGVAFLVLIAMAVFFFEPARPARTPVGGPEEVPSSFPWKVALAYCGVTLFSSVLYYVFIVQSGLAFAAVGVGSSGNLGLLIASTSLGTPIGAIVFNLISRKLRSDRLIVALLLLMGVGMVGMGLAPNVPVMAAFGFLQQVGAGVTVAGLIFWVSQLLPPEHRGRGFGFWTSAFFAGQFLSPLAVGAVRGLTGDILTAFVAMGGVAIAGAALALLFGRRLPRP